ncbi:recombinase RecT [Aromatoleum anaerobium]|uniref:Transcriptional regulator n=1 Tax=Aromatoleum anaerobium TaxID=182180 RepID=A0ABX1PPU5_9RHOO|nr:recombinase RecT [Aromatoleum anaerobium]MCK0507959.1 recombinase RecT [Aromatoleum anaerobium]
MNNVTALAAPKQNFSLAPKDLDEAMRFADILASSSIVPKDYQRNPGNVLVAIQWGMELGLQPMQAMQNIAVINGRPSLWGDAMLALVKGHHAFEWIKEEVTDEGTTCTIKRAGQPEVVWTFTKEDAKRAGLLGKQGPWQQFPKRMMQMRARSFALRDAFPDALKGIHSAEEVRDMPPERDMGAAEVIDTPKPASKTDALKSRLGAAKKPEARAVTLDAVLDEIEQATTPDAMHAAAESAGKLGTDADKSAAREAYGRRVAALKAQAEQAASSTTVDPETGEVTDAQDDFLKDYDAADQSDPAGE